MIASAFDTATDPTDVAVRLLVDDDDPELAAYQQRIPYRVVAGRGWDISIDVGPRVGYTAALNRAAEQLWDDVEVLGAFGDDVVFRTPGWDSQVRTWSTPPRILYPDDLIHGKNHPSAVFMGSAIAKALGWLALPATTHQWADDGWKRLGQATGTLHFLEGVVVEHEHPAVGKADWDDTYAGVFDDARATADYTGFMGWLEKGGLDRDALLVRQLLEAR